MLLIGFARGLVRADRGSTLALTQGYLKLPNGRGKAGRSHDYKRHRTTLSAPSIWRARRLSAATTRGAGAWNFSTLWTGSSPRARPRDPCCRRRLSAHKPKQTDMWRKDIGTSIFSTRSAHTARAKNKLSPSRRKTLRVLRRSHKARQRSREQGGLWA